MDLLLCLQLSQASSEGMIYITINFLLYTLALSCDSIIVLHMLFHAKILQFDAISVSMYFKFQIGATTRFSSMIATANPNLLILKSFDLSS